MRTEKASSGTRLRDHVRPELVLPELRAGDAAGALRVLVAFTAERVGLEDARVIEAALLERERAHTTVLGGGIAVPHITLAALEEPVMVLARAPEGVPFGPPGTGPVRLFFLLLSPQTRSSRHIKLLARIARLVRHPGLIDRMLAARDAQELLSVLGEADAEHV